MKLLTVSMVILCMNTLYIHAMEVPMTPHQQALANLTYIDEQMKGIKAAIRQGQNYPLFQLERSTWFHLNRLERNHKCPPEILLIMAQEMTHETWEPIRNVICTTITKNFLIQANQDSKIACATIKSILHDKLSLETENGAQLLITLLNQCFAHDINCLAVDLKDLLQSKTSISLTHATALALLTRSQELAPYKELFNEYMALFGKK